MFPILFEIFICFLVNGDICFEGEALFGGSYGGIRVILDAIPLRVPLKVCYQG
jgi:hypothetical protein